MIFYIIIAILIICLLILAYYSYSCFFPSTEQRRWPQMSLPKHTEFITFVADAHLDPGTWIKFNMPTPGFKSMFKSKEELEKVKRESINYFKTQFGLSESFINTLMREIRINDDAGYKAQHISSKPDKQMKVIDGGFAMYVPPGTTLYGRYGGKKGVTLTQPAVLAYGWYLVGDLHKIVYKSQCPLQWYITYDAQYNPIDCDIEIVESKISDMIGLKGKAVGLYRNMKLSNGKEYVSIRNVLSLD